MYCPSCGTENTTALNFCNRCGANLSLSFGAPVEPVQVNVTKPVLIISLTMLFLTLGGFAGVISGAIEVVRRAGGGDLPIAIVFFGLVTIMVIDIFLARLLSRLIVATLKPDLSHGKSNRFAATQNQQQLPRPTTAPFVQAASVTENTTRFLEESYRAPSESEPKKQTR